ncbi:hypothetical protein QCD71_12380 [Sphingomonas sp. PsM26]|jgi:hypothetical protein|nr:hypothetical protein [Sphingomonas sp. PsM26]
MGLMTSAGSALALSANLPASLDEAGYKALSFLEVNNIEKIGTIGSQFAKVEFQPLKGPKQKLKGSADYGSVQPSVAHDDADAGQSLLRTASDDETNKLYAFQVTYQNGAKRYFLGRVFGYPETTDGADTVLMAAPTIEICTKVVKVAGSN